MKFHLPKKLFAAVLAAMACSAYAVGPMHAQVRQIVAEGKTTNATMLLKFSNNGPWPGTSNEAPQVWVKDGLGTATVTGDLTLYNPLVVREGTMSMSDCTIKNYTPLSNGVSNLSVGGKDAHLILDGATYKQDLDYSQNYTSAIAIGTGDGAGKLTLLNGSLLHTDHFIFAGVKHASYAGQPAYVVQTTKSQDDDTLYESQHTADSVQRSEINIEGGSVLSAGTCLQFANVDVNIKGEGSELTDLNRDSSPASASYSYFAYSQDAETNINITEGAKVNLKQHLMTGSGANSKTSIKADGNGSSFNLLGYAYMGYGAYDYDAADYVSCGATTTLSLSNGASSSFGTLVIGYKDNTSINVDAASSLEVTDAFYAYQSSDITNAGTISAGTFYTSGKMTLSMGSSLSVASLQIGSGASITVDARNGSAAPITVSGAMDLSTGATVILNFTDTYLSSLETDSSWDGSVKVAFAEVDGSNVTDSRAELAWSENFFWELDEQLAWVVEDTSTYICAKLSRKTEIDLAGQEEIDATITDTATGAAVSVTAKNQDITLSGDNTYSGSTTLDNARLTLGSESALGTSTVKTSGTSAIATAEGITARLSNTIENSGSLTLDGSYDASQMELTEYEATHVDTKGNTGSDGFHRNAGSTIQVVDNAEESSLTLGENFSIAIGTKEYELDTETGTATYDMEIDYSSYTVASADHNVSVSEIQAASDDQTTKVEMSAGALTADADMEVATTGGELTVQNAKVSGSIADTTITSEGGKITAAVSGESYIVANAETTISGENTSTAGMLVYNTALTLGSASALGAGPVNTVETSTITTEEGITATLRAAILNSGTLTLDGSYDASALEVTAIDATRVDIAGNEGASGFHRDAGSSVAVVENCGEESSITLGKNLSVTIGTKEYELDAVTGIATADAGTNYSTYYVASAEHSVSVSEIQAASDDQTTMVEMSAGALTADADMEVATTGGELTVQNAKVSGSIADTAITSEGGEISADISGNSSVAVTGKTTFSGSNTYTGTTTIDGAELVITKENGLGNSEVVMVNHATLDLQGLAVDNKITVYGCTLKGGHSYTGHLEVNGGELTLDEATCADTVEVTNGGNITGASLAANKVTVTNGNSGETSKIASNLTINENGTLTLNSNENLDVSGSLTLGSGSTMILNGDGKVNVKGKVTLRKDANIITSGSFEIGDELITSDSPIEFEDGVKLTYGTLEVELQKGNTALVIVSMFKQELADAYTLSNWGMATASRAVVNAVRGQRTNTGCIANGRGTAWAAVLGGKHDINGGDINLNGAAVGADMKVSARSKLGLALSYTEADIKPNGISSSESTGSYITVYGEHQLKKLSSTSCLSMEWVGSYGITESERSGVEWEQDSLQLNTRLNWNKKVTNRLCMSVFGGLEYFANNSDTVDGVKTGSIQNLRGEIGVGARYVVWGTPGVCTAKGGIVKPGCEKLVLNGEIRYMNDMVRSNPVIEMKGLRGNGENPGRQGIGIEAGATYRISDRWSTSANYGFNTMEGSREHRVNVGASYTF